VHLPDQVAGQLFVGHPRALTGIEPGTGEAHHHPVLLVHHQEAVEFFFEGDVYGSLRPGGNGKQHQAGRAKQMFHKKWFGGTGQPPSSP
jgi:hypothetical protein